MQDDADTELRSKFRLPSPILTRLGKETKYVNSARLAFLCLHSEVNLIASEVAAVYFFFVGVVLLNSEFCYCFQRFPQNSEKMYKIGSRLKALLHYEVENEHNSNGASDTPNPMEPSMQPEFKLSARRLNIMILGLVEKMDRNWKMSADKMIFSSGSGYACSSLLWKQRLSAHHCSAYPKISTI